MSFFAYLILDTGIARLSRGPSKCSPVTYLVVVLHKLYNDFDLCVAVLDTDSSHHIGCVLGIRIIAVFISKYETRVSVLQLNIHTTRQTTKIPHNTQSN